MNTTTKERARRLRNRIHIELGYGAISRIARDLGENRSWMSQVLNGHATSEPMLDRIENYLDTAKQAA